MHLLAPTHENDGPESTWSTTVILPDTCSAHSHPTESSAVCSPPPRNCEGVKPTMSCVCLFSPTDICLTNCLDFAPKLGAATNGWGLEVRTCTRCTLRISGWVGKVKLVISGAVLWASEVCE